MNLDKYEVYSPTVPLDEVRAALDIAELPEGMALSSAGIVICGILPYNVDQPHWHSRLRHRLRS